MTLDPNQEVIDADGHIIESDAELLDYLPEPYRGRDEILQTNLFPGLDGFHRPARRVADGKGRYVVRPTVKDWQDFLDEAKIEWAVLYPTAGLGYGLVRDKDWALALAQAYNNYLSSSFLKKDKRLKGMALIPLKSIPEAVKELKRAVKELGMVGGILPAVGLRQPFGDERYFPIYEAAQELNAILTVHAGPTQDLGLDLLERMIEVRTLSHGFGQMIQMTSMMFGGVFDAFPRLKVAYAEAGCGWVPYLMERMDMEYEHRKAQVPQLKVSPSKHLRSGRIFIHCELEERAIPTVAHGLRDDILFCASDYPHEPRSEFRENIGKFLAREDLTEQTKHRILKENPRRMYSTS
ncbi:MAG: amidohydrolase family protein [Candidatus Binatia bacterium]